MYNWSVDIKNVKKNSASYIIWRLEQLINFGLNGEKIEKKLVKKYWKRLSIDPKRRKLLTFWLWQKLS